MATKPYELDVVIVDNVPLDNSAWRAGWELVKQKGNKVWVTSPADRTVEVEVKASDIASIILHNTAAFVKQDLKLVVIEREEGNQLMLVGRNFANNPPKYDYVSKYAELEIEQPYLLSTKEIVLITEKTRDLDRLILNGKKLRVNQLEPWTLVLDNESCLHLSKFKTLPRKHYAHAVLNRLSNPDTISHTLNSHIPAFNTTRTDNLFFKLSSPTSRRMAVSFENILNCRVPNSLHARDWLKSLRFKLLRATQLDTMGMPVAMDANTKWTFAHTPDEMIGDAIHRYPDRTGGTFEIYESESFVEVRHGRTFKIHYDTASDRVAAMRKLAEKFMAEVNETYYVSGSQKVERLYDNSIEQDIYPVLQIPSREGCKYVHLDLF
jgi:hypothetical protein